VYPTEWTVRIPSQQLELTITTPIADQELSLVGSTGVAYWEGMIDVAGHQAIGPSGNQANGPSGRQANGPTGQQANRLTGVGYLEMTGYHGSLGRVLSGQ
jgi:predicted secreted hydrolase